MALALCLVALLTLVGCKTQLQADLNESEANEMLAILLNHDLDAVKQPGKENLYSLFVEQHQLAQAIDLLQDMGYPRRRFDSVGKVFAQQGVISSPREERIRYIYAISQEMSEALTSLDGVVDAYVQIVMPDNNPFEGKMIPSSASVLIRYRRDAHVDMLAPQIKQFVANAVEGLQVERVSVTMVPSVDQFLHEVSPSAFSLLGVSVPTTSKTPFLLLVGGLVLLLCVLAGMVAYLLYAKRGKAPEGAAHA